MRVGRRALAADLLVIAGLVTASRMFGVSVVSGGSMEPALSPGDLVVFTRSTGPLRAGAIVLLGTVGHRYVHRVVAVTPTGGIATRGDANPIPDRDETSAEEVRGKVVAVLPWGRLLARLASSRR